MLVRTENELKYKKFWTLMEKNSRVVQRMPNWMKGSPINKRIENLTQGRDERMSVKAAASTNR